MKLTQDEVAQLERLEDEQGRGVSVKWDTPKTVRGVVVRDVEDVTFTDQNSGEDTTKKVCTVRTENGLEAIWEGPDQLNSKLFKGERFKDDPSPSGPPRKSDLLIAHYKGEKLSQTSGRDYKAFDVYRSVPEGPTTPDHGAQTELPTTGTDAAIPF